MRDTPDPCSHYHRPLTTVADRVALAMAEMDGPARTWPSGRARLPRAATSEQIAAELGLKSPHVRATMARIRRKLGPQAV